MPAFMVAYSHRCYNVLGHVARWFGGRRQPESQAGTLWVPSACIGHPPPMFSAENEIGAAISEAQVPWPWEPSHPHKRRFAA